MDPLEPNIMDMAKRIKENGFSWVRDGERLVDLSHALVGMTPTKIISKLSYLRIRLTELNSFYGWGANQSMLDAFVQLYAVTFLKNEEELKLSPSGWAIG